MINKIMMLRLTRVSYSVLRSIRSSSSQTPQNDLKFDRQGAIVFIGINNPFKRNALTLDIIYQLKHAFHDFERSDAKVAVLHGEMGSFSSGFDIDEVIEKGYHRFEAAVSDWKKGPLCAKPVVCAVNGYTIAEGLELALACDLRVIEESAILAFLGRRYGVPFSLNGGERLAALVGRSRALDLIMTGRKITGTVGSSWGLAARLVATGTSLGQAFAVATCVAKYPSNALLHDRLEAMRSDFKSDLKLSEKYEKDMENFRKKSLSDIDTLLPKFTEGIGKHGEYKNIIKKPLPHWEEEETAQEAEEEEEKQQLKKF